MKRKITALALGLVGALSLLIFQAQTAGADVWWKTVVHH